MKVQKESLLARIQQLPLGYSEVRYQDKKYSVVRTDFNDGKSVKVFAEELGGTDFISFNFYVTSGGEHLKPCEMPEEKVTDFLRGYVLGKPEAGDRKPEVGRQDVQDAED